MKNTIGITRRSFAQACGLAVGGLALGCAGRVPSDNKKGRPPLAVFSKIYQELKLDFNASAKATADAGLDGVDCAVRPGGEVAPEKVAEQLPQYHEALNRHNLGILAVTTAITNVSSPNARVILETARRLGARHYRLGFWRVKRSEDATALKTKVKADLRELAALNKELGMCGVIENHSMRHGDAAYLGGDLEELRELVEDLNPEQIGVAFDLGHAMIVAPQSWKVSFEKLKPHIQLVYLKDVNAQGKFVPFGSGSFEESGFFKMLHEAGYANPASIHIEYDWAQGKQKTPELLAATLKQCRIAAEQWFRVR